MGVQYCDVYLCNTNNVFDNVLTYALYKIIIMTMSLYYYYYYAGMYNNMQVEGRKISVEHDKIPFLT